MSVLQIPRDVEIECCGPMGRKLMGTRAPSLGVYLLNWKRGREKAAGSSAELEVLVTHSHGGGS